MIATRSFRVRQGVRVYVRISRPDEKTILRNQENAAVGYAASKRWKLLGVYRDIASGGTTNRKGFNELLRDVKPGEIVVFTSLSRMTRGGIGAALDVLRRLELKRVGWNFVEQPELNFDSDTNPLAKEIILSVIAAVDKDYRRRISEKTRAAYAVRKALAKSRNQKLRWGRHLNNCRCARCRKRRSKA